MSLGESIRSGVKWLVVGKIGNRLMEFAFGVILARLLVPADFGMIATIAVFTGFVGMFTSGGMGQSLIRAKAADENDFTAVFTLQLAMGGIVYLAFYLSAPLIADLFGDPLYTDLVRVSALSFLLRPFLTVRNAWLNRQMNFKSRSLVDVSSGFVTGLTSSLMAWFGMGVWSLTLAGLFASLLQSFWLGRLTPLRLSLNLDLPRMRRHSSYGSMIIATDFVSYLRTESKNLILSKFAGPAFLGLFKKAESLSRLPNQLLMSPTMEPLFRAMSKAQDDIDQTKYLYFRSVTLLMAYTAPTYVLLWWIAEPFVGFVYGAKWIEAGATMSVLATAGFFLNVVFPCSVVLAAQNRLGQELLALSLNLMLVVAGCFVGLKWGLNGVAWAIVLSQAALAVHFAWLVQRILGSRLRELLQAVAPGLALSGIMFGALAATDLAARELKATSPVFYLALMSGAGGLLYVAGFLWTPFPALRDEASRWREKLGGGLALIRKALP
jgi:O-antigen/teichoic acid export membrane protein